ncbi:uncharacterized protein LAESUDRAFT_126313 [Laetiporus sulphureus 93-53]|uniref:Uncharacterized protein n=1 Tax=Laetiporus sulphureus 93-53 TaxID=1314785 RepID=A0A165EFT7_9APHY|nr:uncharacterized protein LAESUDRAFT_126313 [Laetiporus sulphureus 93-53]KZT06970.1 hypothetical protein LAESUDRAFT_126313 [Laetiporus sulphureus 93-53]
MLAPHRTLSIFASGLRSEYSILLRAILWLVLAGQDRQGLSAYQQLADAALWLTLACDAGFGLQRVAFAQLEMRR